MQKLVFDNQQIISYADQSTPIPGGYILQGANVSLEFKSQPKEYYRHGWHSWSLTTWQAANFRLPTQKPVRLHPMQTDPLYANYPAPNGSWLGAVGFENGKVLLLGALGLESHVALHNQTSESDTQLHGWYEAPRIGHKAGDGEWFVGYGDEASVFAR